METLVEKLGLDWKLLLSQAVNFLILLGILGYLGYQPLLKMLAERRKKIEQGLEKAEEAERRLAGISELEKDRLKDAEKKGVAIIIKAEESAKAEEKKILAGAAAKENEIMERAQERAAQSAAEAEAKLEKEAAELVKKILIERVHLKPEAVDEALIQKVATQVKKSS